MVLKTNEIEETQREDWQPLRLFDGGSAKSRFRFSHQYWQHLPSRSLVCVTSRPGHPIDCAERTVILDLAAGAVVIVVEPVVDLRGMELRGVNRKRYKLPVVGGHWLNVTQNEAIWFCALSRAEIQYAVSHGAVLRAEELVTDSETLSLAIQAERLLVEDGIGKAEPQ